MSIRRAIPPLRRTKSTYFNKFLGMPYMDHPQFQSPSDDTVIWRYMDFPKLLHMLETGKLYFSLLSELEDKWEGVLSRAQTTSIATQFMGASGQIIGDIQRSFEAIAVNCWHRNKDESIAMWTLYTKADYGIAIKSTVGELKKAVADSPLNIHIGEVEYCDYLDNSSPVLTVRTLSPIAQRIEPMPAILQKRTCFEHECEIRAFTQIFPKTPEHLVPGELLGWTAPQHGTLVHVDLAVLISSITTGPGFRSWTSDLLREALKRAKIDPPVQESEAFKPPEDRFVE